MVNIAFRIIGDYETASVVQMRRLLAYKAIRNLRGGQIYPALPDVNASRNRMKRLRARIEGKISIEGSETMKRVRHDL
jgi:hypothetical protein